MADAPEFIRLYEKLYGVTYKRENNMGAQFLVGDKVEFTWGSTILTVVATQGNYVWVQGKSGDPYTANRENLQAYVPPKPKAGEVWRYLSQGISGEDGFRIIGVDESAGIYWMVKEESFTWSKTVTYGETKPYSDVPDKEVAHKFGLVWKRPLNNIPSHFVKVVDY